MAEHTATSEGFNKDAKNEVEIVLFFAIWDEEIGPNIIEFCPKTSLLDLESLANNIFATYELQFGKAEEQFKTIKVTLPVATLNRKAHVLLEVVRNKEIRGGFQPFIVVILVPDYVTEGRLATFDPVISKIAITYINEKKVILKEEYPELDLIYKKGEGGKESDQKLSEYYSYTAAVEDFRAGVQLFQTKNYDDALPVLFKALKKFEQENHKALMMETIFIIANSYAQKKQFGAAEPYFLRLDMLAEELNHEKYKELSKFMAGFCAYKCERFVEAIEDFSRLELFKKQFVNEFQYNTMYSRALAKIQNYEDAIKKLRLGLRIVENAEKIPVNMKQQAQIKFELGLMHYQLALAKKKKLGVKKREDLSDILNESIECLTGSIDIWKEIGDTKQQINLYSTIGDVFEFIGDNSKFFENYNKGLEIAEGIQDTSNQIKLLKRIIQKQSILELHGDNIKSIKRVLKKLENYKLMDLHTLSTLYKHLGISLVKTDQLKEGLEELIKAYQTLENFKSVVDESLQILNRIIVLSNRLKDKEKVEYYTKKRDIVAAKLKEKEKETAKKEVQLGALKDIWIFSINEGIELYSYSLETKVETDLIGGFMSAIQALSQQATYKTLDSMVFGDNRFTIYTEENRGYYILARSSAKTLEETLGKILKTIYNRFWKEFSHELINFKGNVTAFRKFTKNLESFDWTLLSTEEEIEKVKPSVSELKKSQEMKVIAVTLPQEQNTIPSSESLKERAFEKREQLMKKTPILFLQDLKEQAITENVLKVFKENRVCIVHKGTIEGYNFMCPSCDALYCVKCVDALIELENICWSCGSPLDPSKPSQKDELLKEKDEPTIATEGKAKLNMTKPSGRLR